MNLLSLNLLLAVVWCMLTGSFTLVSLVTGFVLGFAALWVLRPLLEAPRSYFTRTFHWIRLVVMFHYELVVSSIEVVVDVLTPQHRSRPAIVDVPLDVKSDAGILLVTNLISLTPGTLSLDVSPDRSTLRVHAMFGEDPDAVRRQLKDGMERWVRLALGE
jgi:multicomponent Na+:H+ antiporter subunit E